MPTSAPPLFSVKAASNITGLSPHALRAWERRYQAVTPRRSPLGRRLYTSKDVERLKLLARLTEHGHMIGSLSGRSDSELSGLLKHELHRGASGSSTKIDAADELRGLLTSVSSFMPEKIERHLIALRLHLPLRNLIFDIFSPLMNEIGSSVETGRLDIAQEHLVSTNLRNHLGELLGLVQRSFVWGEDAIADRPRLLFTTPEGDLHEFGIMLAALIAGSQGFKFVYLGPNMPAADLAKAIAHLGPDILVLGSSTRASQPLSQYLETLNQSLFMQNGNINQIWIGGSGNTTLAMSDRQRRIRRIPTLQSFERELSKTTKQSEIPR